MPYSEFLKSVNNDAVEAVWIDGQKVMWRPRSQPASNADTSSPSTMPSKGAHQSSVPADSSQKARSASTGDAQTPTASSTAASVAYSSVKPADMATPYNKLMENDVVFGSSDYGKQQSGGLTSVAAIAVYIMLIIAYLGRLPLPSRRFGRSASGTTRLDQVARQRQQDGESRVAKMSDVAGVDDAKEELTEVIDILKDPERFSKVGARPPKGLLLAGPPGTGKTLLARAVAGEAGVPFEACSASSFIELFVGTGAARVREVFNRARQNAPSVVFIDELDAIGKSRGGGDGRGVGNDEREQTLNQLLTELDGFEVPSKPVIVIAATNRADIIDSALTRPGRFDRTVQVELPDLSGRIAILWQHISSKAVPLGEDVSVPQIAQRAQGMSGAGLATLVNEATLLAARDFVEQVSHLHFDNAVLRTIAGIEKKSDSLAGRERTTVARHEAGHAVVATAVHTARKARHANGENDDEGVGELPSQVSIIARQGGALGFTHTPASEDRKLAFEEDIKSRLATLLGGRAAEQASIGALSTGASDDIAQATRLVYQSAATLGLSENIGPLAVPLLDTGGGGDEASAPLGGSARALTAEVEDDVRHVVHSALNVAVETVKANEKSLMELSRRLEESGRISGEELQSILKHVSAPSSLADFIFTSIAAAQSREERGAGFLQRDEGERETIAELPRQRQ